nr:probable methyltransferase PMT5 [Tanacetum cinerariifolium]
MSLSSGDSNLKEVSLCGREKEHYVPYYNVSANLLTGFKDGEEFDWHCELSRDQEECLVRPPRDYKTPLSRPVGRDVIWNANVKISKDQILSSGSMTKRLMLVEENQIYFHSNYRLLFDGVKKYSRQVAEMIGLGSDDEFLNADGIFLIEVDQILKPGGHFVLHGSSLSTKQGSMASPIEAFTQKICWTHIVQQETFVWQKTTDEQCYSSGISGTITTHTGTPSKDVIDTVAATSTKRNHNKKNFATGNFISCKEEKED